jgi:cyclase
LADYNPPGGKVPLPTITYAHDYTIKLGGIEAQLFHFGNARTDGDTVVYFPNLQAVAVGDLYAQTPDPDFAAGGSLVGWGPVLGEILKLDFDVAVPGTGPPIGRADLEAFKAKIDILVARATALVKKGVPKDQLMAQLKTDDLGWQFNFNGDRLDRFYDELSRVK